MSVGFIVVGFAAAAALTLWHWIAATKRVSDELLREYQRLLSEAPDNLPSDD